MRSLQASTTRPGVTRSVVAAAFTAAASLSCSDVADPRPQLLVIVDTDLPTVLQAAEREGLSADAAVDALRIDVYAGGSSPIQSLVVIAPSPDDWPVSFGIPVIDDVSTVLVQARAFRADRAREGTGADEGLLVPDQALTVNRVVSLSFPQEGIQLARVTLSGDCLGIPPSFEAPATSCIDASSLTAPATEGVSGAADARDRPTAAGTWPVAVEEPCVGNAPAGARCIAGGFTTLGEEGLTGASDGFSFAYDPVPLRPVRISPFFADVEEYTVGRLRAALLARPGLLLPDEVVLQDPDNDLRAECTFLGEDVEDNDRLPLNCVTYAGARKLCQAAGGDLLSEAQWEHAARGRGQSRPFAWVGSVADCCHGNYLDCVGLPAEPGSASCDDGGDVSRDGLLDMTGNLHEVVIDSHVPYDAPCWTKLGLLENPVCEDDSVATKTWRGGSYAEDVEEAHLALRRQGLAAAPVRTIGLRCAYPDSAQ